MTDFRNCAGGLLRLAGNVRLKLVISTVTGLVGVALSLAFVLISKRVIDIATGHMDADLVENITIMAGIMLAQVLVSVFAGYWEGYVVIRTANSYRAACFKRAFCSVWDGRDRFHSGDTVNRLEEDIRVVTEFVCVNLPAILVTLTQLSAATTLLFILSPSLGWYLVFIMPVGVVGSRLFFKKMRRITNDIRKYDSLIQSHMQENILQRIVIKTMGGTSYIIKKLFSLQDELEEKTVSRLNYGALSRSFLQIGFATGYALAFFWGVFGLRDGTVTYGLMVAFLQLVSQVQRPVADIARHIPAFIRALSSADRLLEIEESAQEDESGTVLLEGAPGVRVDDLSFSYPGQDSVVIEHLDFDFKPGTMNAIIGCTGAGKSTLIRIILGLLKPDSGKVVLYPSETVSNECGHPDSAFSGSGDSVTARQEVESSAATRCNFMYVPQGNSLLSGTIRQNLLLARPDASEEEMKEALHLAAADFVYDLQDGLQTPCSEVGRGLSEGQAQRIAIARALLRPGGILVLDEATSALDADTELELLNRLNRHFKGSKTILCITHRPAATSFADSVLKI